MPTIETYEAPNRLEEALELLAANRGRVRPIAGGTDVLVRLKRGLHPERETIFLSLKNLSELHTIAATDPSTDGGGGLRIGAAATMRALESSELVHAHAPVLADAANKIASPQVRATATIGGNVANASPAADTAIPLLLLDAEVETARLQGGSVITKRTPIERFFTGPGETTLEEGELITAFHIPAVANGMRFVFNKGGVRPAMECAVVSVGCGVRLDSGGVVQQARVAFGAVAPTPIRAHAIETHLTGDRLSNDHIDRASQLVDDAIQPIDDVRGSAAYRRGLITALLKMALYELGGTAPAGEKSGGRA
jgi:CO/xanthine dehydrogenase FAD-binding subunit